MPHPPGHTLRYAFLYHREIVAVNFLPTLLFLYPVYMGGVIMLPIVAFGKTAISVLLIYLQFRNLDAKNVFFINRNFRIRNLHLVYFTVDFIAYGMCTAATFALR